MSYVCIHSSTTADDADKLLAAFYLCCLSTTTLVVLILAYGIHTGRDSCYLPTAADFCMPGPLFARAVHISQVKIGPGGPPDQLMRGSNAVMYIGEK